MVRKLSVLIIMFSVRNAVAQCSTNCIISIIYAISVKKLKPFRVVYFELGAYNMDFLNEMELLCSISLALNYFMAFLTALDERASVAAGFFMVCTSMLVVILIISIILFRLWVRSNPFAQVKSKSDLSISKLDSQEVELVDISDKKFDPLGGRLDQRYTTLRGNYTEILRKYNQALIVDSLNLEQAQTNRPALIKSHASLHDYFLQQIDVLKGQIKAAELLSEIRQALVDLDKVHNEAVIIDEKNSIAQEAKAWEEAFADNCYVGIHYLAQKQDLGVVSCRFKQHKKLIQQGTALVVKLAKAGTYQVAFSLRDIIFDSRMRFHKKNPTIEDKSLKEYYTFKLQIVENTKHLLIRGDKSVDERCVHLHFHESVTELYVTGWCSSRACRRSLRPSSFFLKG